MKSYTRAGICGSAIGVIIGILLTPIFVTEIIARLSDKSYSPEEIEMIARVEQKVSDSIKKKSTISLENYCKNLEGGCK